MNIVEFVQFSSAKTMVKSKKDDLDLLKLITTK